jgi:CMP-2-keto-3-deoxyoctulosonic acid synthetase
LNWKSGIERIGEVAAAAINASSTAAVSASGAFPMMTADLRQVRANLDMMAVNLLTEVTDSSALSLLRRWRRVYFCIYHVVNIFFLPGY